MKPKIIRPYKALHLENPFAAVQEKFRERLSEWRDKTDASAAQLGSAVEGSPEWRKVLEEFHVLAHTMAGSAPVFGYEDVGARARAAEICCQDLLAGDAEDAAATRSKLLDETRQLMRSLENARAEPLPEIMAVKKPV